MNWKFQAPTRSQVKTGLPGISLVSEPFADVVLRPVIRAVHLASEGLRFRFVCMAKVLLRLLLFLHTGYWLSLFLCQTLRIHTCLDVLMYLIRTISHFIKHLQIHSIFSLIYRTSWLVSDGANFEIHDRNSWNHQVASHSPDLFACMRSKGLPEHSANALGFLVKSDFHCTI